MGLIGTLNQGIAGQVISPTEYNQNMDSIRDTFNTYAVLTDVARTITVQHTYNPGSASAPFLLGANALNQLVTGLNADQLDSQEGSFYQNASNLNAGTVPSARVTGSYTGITGVGTLTTPVVSTSAGPHAFGGSGFSNVALAVQSSGSFDHALFIAPTINPAAGNDAAIVSIWSTSQINEASSGIHNIVAALRVDTPTIGAGLGSINHAATVYIGGSPTAGTVSNSALRVNSGASRFLGGAYVNDGAAGSPSYTFDSDPTVGFYRVAGGVAVTGTSNAMMILNHASATGSPLLEFMQVGVSRAYLAFNDAADIVELSNKYGAIDLQAGSAGVWNTRVQIRTDFVHLLNSTADEQLRIDHASSTGNPFVTFYQNGQRRSYLQHTNGSNSFLIVSEFGPVEILAGDVGGAEASRASFFKDDRIDSVSASNENIRMVHTSATGSPYISFYQTSTTRRAFIQYEDASPALNIFTDEAGSSIRFGTAAALRATITANSFILSAGVDLDLNDNDISRVESIAFTNGATVNNVLTGTVVWDPGNLISGDTTSTTLTVTGAAVGDVALVDNPFANSNLVLQAYVSSANTVTLMLKNTSSGSIDPASTTIRVWIIKA